MKNILNVHISINELLIERRGSNVPLVEDDPLFCILCAWLYTN